MLDNNNVRFFQYFGQIILNGRWRRDEEGEFTFVGPRGTTVINLSTVTVNQDLTTCLEK